MSSAAHFGGFTSGGGVGGGFRLGFMVHVLTQLGTMGKAVSHCRGE
jgi:hypothetical protein